MTELQLVLVSAVIFALMVAVTIYARRKSPGVLWVGIALSVFCGPVGQLYLRRKAALWMVFVLILTMAAAALLPPGNIAFLAQMAISPAVMFYRMKA